MADISPSLPLPRRNSTPDLGKLTPRRPQSRVRDARAPQSQAPEPRLPQPQAPDFRLPGRQAQESQRSEPEESESQASGPQVPDRDTRIALLIQELSYLFEFANDGRRASAVIAYAIGCWGYDSYWEVVNYEGNWKPSNGYRPGLSKEDILRCIEVTIKLTLDEMREINEAGAEGFRAIVDKLAIDTHPNTPVTPIFTVGPPMFRTDKVRVQYSQGLAQPKVLTRTQQEERVGNVREPEHAQAGFSDLEATRDPGESELVVAEGEEARARRSAVVGNGDFIAGAIFGWGGTLLALAVGAIIYVKCQQAATR